MTKDFPSHFSWSSALTVMLLSLSSSCALLHQRSSSSVRIPSSHRLGASTITESVITASQLSFSSSTSLFDALLQKVEPSRAQGEFYFFFFGGSGALGIGFAQIPKLLDEFKLVQSLGGGKTLGGEALKANPIATLGFPEPLRASDVEYIIKNAPTVATIASKGPKKSYMAQQGYLEREGFYNCLPKANPLALYAAFDALGKGGGDLASPSEVSQMLDSWKGEGGLEQFKNDLLAANLRKYSAYSVFFFLIAVVLDLIIESAQNAFLN